MAGRARTEKMSVTLPKELASEIRSISPQGEISALFAEALEHYLAYRRQSVALEKGFGAWGDERHPELNTPADSTAHIRGIREVDKKRLKYLGGAGAKQQD